MMLGFIMLDRFKDYPAAIDSFEQEIACSIASHGANTPATALGYQHAASAYAKHNDRTRAADYLQVSSFLYLLLL
jgi:hypothetical protein